MIFQRERKIIMDVYLENTRATDEEVRQYAYQGLVEIVDRYYAGMKDHIQDIYSATFSTFQGDEDDVIKMAIELWATIAEVEKTLILEVISDLFVFLLSPVSSLMLYQPHDAGR